MLFCVDILVYGEWFEPHTLAQEAHTSTGRLLTQLRFLSWPSKNGFVYVANLIRSACKDMQFATLSLLPSDTHRINGVESDAHGNIHTAPLAHEGTYPVNGIGTVGTRYGVGGASRSLWPEEDPCVVGITEHCRCVSKDGERDIWFTSYRMPVYVQCCHILYLAELLTHNN